MICENRAIVFSTWKFLILYKQKYLKKTIKAIDLKYIYCLTHINFNLYIVIFPLNGFVVIGPQSSLYGNFKFSRIQ